MFAYPSSDEIHFVLRTEFFKKLFRVGEHCTTCVLFAFINQHHSEIAIVVGHAFLAAELFVKGQRFLVHRLGPVQIATGLVDQPAIARSHGDHPLIGGLIAQRQDLFIGHFRAVEFPQPHAQMAQFIPSFRVSAVQRDGFLIGFERFSRVMVERQGPYMTRGPGGILKGSLSRGTAFVLDLPEQGCGRVGPAFAQFG